MQALKGLRVLDLTRLLPGPYGSMYLSDFGAEVIKIEQPGEGDYARGYAPVLEGLGYRFLITNRGKKSVSLNLKSREGKEIFLGLVRKSDVVMESFRPGVMAKLGLGYDDLKAVNPGIIFCSLSGFGQQGPYALDAGHDINYAGLAGIVGLTGEKQGPPIIPGIQIADLTAGLMAVIGILSAVVARRNTGVGQFVDVSLFASAVAMLASDAGTYFGSNHIPMRGTERLTGGWPHYSIYKTKDGEYLACGALEKKFWSNLCRVIGRDELIDAIDDVSNWEDIGIALTKAFKQYTLAQWIEKLDGKDTCVTPIQTLDKSFSDPHVIENELVFEVEDELLGRHRQMGFPIKLSKTPASYRTRAPYLGEHNHEILTGLGYSDDQIDRLSKDGVI
jgi:crotonobetainyl-CoA:carnitine CoA-transferase CaiB-like acyl-CoA transferase